MDLTKPTTQQADRESIGLRAGTTGARPIGFRAPGAGRGSGTNRDVDVTTESAKRYTPGPTDKLCGDGMTSTPFWLQSTVANAAARRRALTWPAGVAAQGSITSRWSLANLCREHRPRNLTRAWASRSHGIAANECAIGYSLHGRRLPPRRLCGRTVALAGTHERTRDEMADKDPVRSRPATVRRRTAAVQRR